MKLKLLLRSRPVSRVADAPAPGLWVAAWRRVMGADAEVVESALGDELEHVSPCYLVAAWKPLAAGQFALRRYPAVARLASADGDGEPVLRVLLKLLPSDARLFVPEMDVDWGLIAEIAMASEPEPTPDRLRLLQAVMRRERHKRFEQIRRRFQPEGAGGRDAQPPFAPTQTPDD